MTQVMRQGVDHGVVVGTQRIGRPLMQPSPLRDREIRVGDLADQRMREPHTVRATRDDEGPGKRFVQESQHLVRRRLDQVCQRRDGEVPAQHRRRRKQLPGGRRNGPEPVTDHLPHTARQPRFGRGRSPGQPEQLEREERIALAALGDGAQQPGRRGLAQCRRGQLCQLGTPKASEHEPVTGTLTRDRRKRLTELAAGDVASPITAQHDDRPLADLGGQHLKQSRRSHVRPMQIIEHDE